MKTIKKAIYKIIFGGIITYITMSIVYSMQIITQYGNDLIFEYPLKAWLIMPFALYGAMLFLKGINMLILKFIR